MPLVTHFDSDPAIDGRQSSTALDVQRGIITTLGEAGITFLTEFTLPTGRRADLIGLEPNGTIIIIEVKSSVADYNADQKWPEYKALCDRFYFASHPSVAQEIFPDNEGFILSDRHGCEVLREAEPNKIAAATRKSLTHKIARASMMRLRRMVDFHGPELL